MSMPSALSNAQRRVPQQDRAARRVSSLLETAAVVIAENGYEATTMTEIAERARASIGCVYQYFPDKEALARALHSQLAGEIERHWAPLIQEAHRLTTIEIAEKLIDLMAEFFEAHPAYLPLSAAPIKFARSPEARHRLRNRFADAFMAKNPNLTKDAAWLTGNVTLQIVKGFFALYAVAKPKDKAELVQEFKAVLTAYLKLRL